jgi:ribosomal-protein-alanine N-acetyltransferase
MTATLEYPISRATETEVPGLIRVSEACRLSPWSQAGFLDELRRSDSVLLCARSVEHGLVGFIVGRIYSESETRAGEIYNIGVLEEARLCGIGSRLLEAFISRCRDASIVGVWLEVRVSNSMAIKFYENKGFTVAARRRNFYSDPVEDGFQMKLSLPDRMADDA